MTLCAEVLRRLAGKSLVTAESLTGGGIGAALTAVSGASEVYKGGVICYTNWVKENVLKVDRQLLDSRGPVCAPVAEAMAAGVRRLLEADVAVSVTGLAGPGGDEYGNPVGTVFIGFQSAEKSTVRECHFEGDRDQVRRQTIQAALKLILEMTE